jgi:hypothetical protein
VADHPLRPATRKSLGKPLPHQQADRPRAHPQPETLSTPTHADRCEYPVLDPVSQAYPKAEGRLLTCYSPVRRSSTPKGAFPHDLHVLSTPPAFVLSQDQTLQKNQKSTIQAKPKNQDTTQTRAMPQQGQKNIDKRHTVEFSKIRPAVTPRPRATTKHYPRSPSGSNLRDPNVTEAQQCTIPAPSAVGVRPSEHGLGGRPPVRPP